MRIIHIRIIFELSNQQNKENMKWKEFEKIARSKGWYFSRHGAKHDIYLHPDRPDVLQIERHWTQEIKPGLFKKLKKQVGF